MLGVGVSVCVRRTATARRISLGGEGNALYPVLSRYLLQVNGVNGRDNVFVRYVSVCVCAQRTGQSDRLKTVKLRTSYMACMFPGTVRTRPLKKFCEKGASVKIHLAEICTLTSAF